MGHNLRFMVMGLVSRLSVANHLAWPIFRLTQGPLWWRVHLSAKMDSSGRVSGRLAGHIISSLLLSAPPEFSRLVFGGSTVFFIRTSCCETTQESTYHPAWPRRAVLVNGSLTILLSILKCTLRPYLLGCVYS